MLLIVNAVQVRFMHIIGCRYMLLLMYAFNLPGSHIMTNAGLADLHKISTGPVKSETDPNLVATHLRRCSNAQNWHF